MFLDFIKFDKIGMYASLFVGGRGARALCSPFADAPRSAVQVKAQQRLRIEFVADLIKRVREIRAERLNS